MLKEVCKVWGGGVTEDFVGDEQDLESTAVLGASEGVEG